MAQEYKITKISQQQPKEYEGQHGTIYYIKVMLEGHDKPVSIGKKSPDALKEGDTAYGTIIPTEYDTDKFKAERPQGAPGSSNFKPRDDEAIKAQWAIGQAVHMFNVSFPELDSEARNNWEASIEKVATKLFTMVGRVKDSNKPAVDKVFPNNEKEETNSGDIPF